MTKHYTAHCNVSPISLVTPTAFSISSQPLKRELIALPDAWNCTLQTPKSITNHCLFSSGLTTACENQLLYNNPKMLPLWDHPKHLIWNCDRKATSIPYQSTDQRKISSKALCFTLNLDMTLMLEHNTSGTIVSRVTLSVHDATDAYIWSEASLYTLSLKMWQLNVSVVPPGCTKRHSCKLPKCWISLFPSAQLTTAWTHQLPHNIPK